MFAVCVCVFPNFFSNKSRSFLLHTICTARICQRNLRGRPSLYTTGQCSGGCWRAGDKVETGGEWVPTGGWWCLVFGIKSMPGGEWTIPTAELHQAGLRIEVSPLVKNFSCNSRCATWIWKHGSFATAISSAPIGGWRRIAESSESALQQRWARHPNTICFVNRFGSPDSWIVTRINGFSQTASKNAVSWAMGNWKILANTFEYVHLVHGFC